MRSTKFYNNIFVIVGRIKQETTGISRSASIQLFRGAINLHRTHTGRKKICFHIQKRNLEILRLATNKTTTFFQLLVLVVGPGVLLTAQ